MSSLELLQQLCATPALSGFEEPMIRLMRSEFARHSQDVRVDRLGNVLARLPAAQPDAATLLIAAHMDELGFVVSRVEPDGFLRLNRLGGIPERALPARMLAVHSDDGRALPAVVGMKAHHLTPADERLSVLPLERSYVDLGLGSAEAVAAAGVRVGSPVTYWRNFQQLGELIVSNTLDNRLGCYALLEIVRRLAATPLPVNLVAAATVHEEFSGRGSVVAARGVRPDLAIALDIAIACDTPDLRGSSDVALGRGPVILTYTFHPRGPVVGTLPNPKLRDLMRQSAERHDLPYQLGTFFGGLTDATYMQYVDEGIPVLELGIPARYAHAPGEAAMLRDAEAAIDLLCAFVHDLPPHPDLSRG